MRKKTREKERESKGKGEKKDREERRRKEREKKTERKREETDGMKDVWNYYEGDKKAAPVFYETRKSNNAA